MKVLLIDDCAGDVVLILLAIQRINVDLTIVTTAAQAMKSLRNCEWNAIICDVNIPGAIGREVIDSLRRMSNCPVIVCTGIDKSEVTNGDISKDDLESLANRLSEIKNTLTT